MTPDEPNDSSTLHELPAALQADPTLRELLKGHSYGIEISQVNDALYWRNAASRQEISQAHRFASYRMINYLQMIFALIEMELGEGDETLPASCYRRTRRYLHTVHAALGFEMRFSLQEGAGIAFPLAAFVESVAFRIAAYYPKRALHIEVEAEGVTPFPLNEFGVICAELLDNAFRHGAGTVTLAVKRDTLQPAVTSGKVSPAFRLEITDEGPGFPADFAPAAAAFSSLELVEGIVRGDFKGQITYSNREKGGACVVATLFQRA